MRDQARIYRMRVRGQLDEGWGEWFAGMAVTLVGSGETLLTGSLADQAELFGVLKRVRDCGLELLALNQVEPDSGATPGADEKE